MVFRSMLLTPCFVRNAACHTKQGCVLGSTTAKQAKVLQKLSVGQKKTKKIAHAMVRLGLAYSKADRNDEARPLLDQGVAFYKSMFPTDHPKVGKFMTRLAMALSKVNIHEEALPRNKTTLADDNSEIGDAMSHLASTYLEANRLKEALPLLEDSLTLYKRVLRKDHPKIVGAIGRLGVVYCNCFDRHEEARPLLEEHLELRKRMSPKNHLNIGYAMNSLAVVYWKLNRDEEALPLMEASQAIYKKELPKDDPAFASPMYLMARIYARLKMHDKALRLLKQCMAFAKRVTPDDCLLIADVMHSLAVVYCQLNRLEEALPLVEASRAIYKKELPKDDPVFGTTMLLMARIHQCAPLEMPDKALRLLKQCMAFAKRVTPDDYDFIAEVMHGLATTYTALDRHSEALCTWEKLLPLCRRFFPQDSPRIDEVTDWIVFYKNNIAEWKGK